MSGMGGLQDVILGELGFELRDYLRLPHPARLDVLGLPRLIAKNPKTRNMAAALAQPDVTPDDILVRTDSVSTDLAHGLGHSLLVPLKHAYGGGRLFQIRDSLLERLLLTDIDEDLPCRSLRLPYRLCYFHLERVRDDFGVPNDETGEHPWEGVYLQEYDDATYFAVNGKGEEVEHRGRVIELMFIGRTKDGQVDNDATWAVPLMLADDSSLKTELERLVEARIERAARTAKAPYTQREVELMHRLVLQTARILLYLNCAQVRTEDVKTRSALEARLARTGPGKRAKLERQALRAYDHILVGPERFAEALPTPTGGRTVGAHLRRGHFRNQRYGEGLALTKVVWIEATMVKAGEAGDSRSYIVR